MPPAKKRANLGLEDSFNGPSFADIIASVYNRVDDTHTQYYMHQVIVCNLSDHFRQLCINAPADESGYKLLTFDTTPSAFELIAEWVYGKKVLDRKSPSNNIGTIQEAIVYATKFEMEDLRVALLDRLLNSEPQNPYDTSSPLAWQRFKDACKYGIPKDRERLTSFVQSNLPGISPPTQWLQELATESKNGLLTAILLSSYSDDIGDNNSNYTTGSPGSYGHSPYGNDSFSNLFGSARIRMGRDRRGNRAANRSHDFAWHPYQTNTF
ncbi:hypothetical protein TWF718_005360 [Orbilia javanica]|uniref:BTB domain-containing protein n=1 Tax=Orbilia javanica TaxID=47235 RepID=A0AAN8MUA6_9PEZI